MVGFEREDWILYQESKAQDAVRRSSGCDREGRIRIFEGHFTRATMLSVFDAD
jgi:hypothetical protein